MNEDSSESTSLLVNSNQEYNTMDPNKQHKQKEEGKVYLGIEMKPKYTLANLLAIPLLAFCSALLVQDIVSLGIFLIANPQFFTIEEGKLAKVINDLLFYIVFGQIVLILIVGLLYDILGRKIMILTMAFTNAALCIIFPYTGPHIYPWYFLLRLIFAVSYDCLIFHPLINDYVKQNSRGKAYSMHHFAMALGFMLSIAVVFNATKNMDLRFSHLVAGLLQTTFGVVYIFIIQEPYRKKQKKEGFCQNLKNLFTIAGNQIKSSTTIQALLIGGIITKFDIAIVLSFQLLWLISLVSDQGTLKTEEDSKRAYVLINFVSTSVALIGVAVTSKFTDRFNVKITFTVILVIKILNRFAVFLIGNPLSAPSFIIWTIQNYLFLLTTILVDSQYSKQLAKEVRGFMISIMTMLGLVGKGISAKVGGELIIRYGVLSPFIFIAISEFLYLIYLLILFWLGKFNDMNTLLNEAEQNDIQNEEKPNTEIHQNEEINQDQQEITQQQK